MDNSLRADLCQEQKTLLEQWLQLLVNPNTTQRDLERVKNRIDEIHDLLGELNAKEGRHE